MSTQLVVGAGSVGSEVARLLAADGNDVVVVTRHGSAWTAPAMTRILGLLPRGTGDDRDLLPA